MYSGGSPPSARISSAWSSAFARWSEPRITCEISKSRSSTALASWYVGVPSARSSVVCPKRSAPSASGSPIRCAASRWRTYRSLWRRGPSSQRDAEPREVGLDRLGAALDVARGVGVVDPQQKRAAVLVGEAPVRDRAQRAAEVQRSRGLGAKRTLTMGRV